MFARLALLLAALALISAPLALSSGRASAAAADAESAVQAERYFSCPSGYAFRAARDAAHCKKAGRYDYDQLMPCPNNLGVGLFAKVDAIGNKDMCSGTNPITGEVAVERGCRMGYTKRIVARTDQCRRWVSGDIVAPSVEVSR